MKNLPALVLFGTAILGICIPQAEARERGTATQWLQQRHFERSCATEPKARDERMIDRLTGHLKLSDVQKASLRDVHSAFLKAREEARAICTTKPDFTTVPGRMTYDEAAMTARLNGAKMVHAKMDVFYASLDADQKTKFNTGFSRNQRSWRHPDDR